MHLFDLIAVLIVLAAGFSYINFRFLKLPPTIGLMVLALLFSLAIVVTGTSVPLVERQARVLVERLDFDEALLHGMLGFLLFAGSIHVNLSDLVEYRWPVIVLATLGVILSTALVGIMTFGVLTMLGISIRPIDCLIFGALISPTDPIAVLALLKRIGAPRSLEIQIAGESLFNDGVGVVLFASLVQVGAGRRGLDLSLLGEYFVQQALGGALFGLAIGWLVYRLLKSVDNYQVEILLSLALVAGGYAAAEALHVSGPISMVVAGLLIGNQGRSFAMSPTTNDHLDLFWELIDEILNAVLFVVIGLEVLILDFGVRDLLAGALAIGVVLLARLISAGLPVWLLRRWEPFQPYLVPILTWGGLRGGISVALALSLRDRTTAAAGSTPGRRELILVMTYVVVVFSILVQGLTISPLTRWWLGRTRPAGHARRAGAEAEAGAG